MNLEQVRKMRNHVAHNLELINQLRRQQDQAAPCRAARRAHRGRRQSALRAGVHGRLVVELGRSRAADHSGPHGSESACVRGVRGPQSLEGPTLPRRRNRCFVNYLRSSRSMGCVHATDVGTQHPASAIVANVGRHSMTSRAPIMNAYCSDLRTPMFLSRRIYLAAQPRQLAHDEYCRPHRDANRVGSHF